jgi:hypothetical protein
MSILLCQLAKQDTHPILEGITFLYMNYIILNFSNKER